MVSNLIHTVTCVPRCVSKNETKECIAFASAYVVNLKIAALGNETQFAFRASSYKTRMRRQRRIRSECGEAKKTKTALLGGMILILRRQGRGVPWLRPTQDAPPPCRVFVHHQPRRVHSILYTRDNPTAHPRLGSCGTPNKQINGGGGYIHMYSIPRRILSYRCFEAMAPTLHLLLVFLLCFLRNHAFRLSMPKINVKKRFYALNMPNFFRAGDGIFLSSKGRLVEDRQRRNKHTIVE